MRYRNTAQTPTPTKRRQLGIGAASMFLSGVRPICKSSPRKRMWTQTLSLLAGFHSVTSKTCSRMLCTRRLARADQNVYAALLVIGGATLSPPVKYEIINLGWGMFEVGISSGRHLHRQHHESEKYESISFLLSSRQIWRWFLCLMGNH